MNCIALLIALTVRKQVLAINKYQQESSDQDEVIFTQIRRLRKRSLLNVYLESEVLVFLGKS